MIDGLSWLKKCTTFSSNHHDPVVLDAVIGISQLTSNSAHASTGEWVHQLFQDFRGLKDNVVVQEQQIIAFTALSGEIIDPCEVEIAIKIQGFDIFSAVQLIKPFACFDL